MAPTTNGPANVRKMNEKIDKLEKENKRIFWEILFTDLIILAIVAEPYMDSIKTFIGI